MSVVDAPTAPPVLTEKPPVSHPPAGILSFLDVESIKDTGFRLARFSREDCSFMGPEGIVAKVRNGTIHAVYTVSCSFWRFRGKYRRVARVFRTKLFHGRGSFDVIKRC